MRSSFCPRARVFIVSGEPFVFALAAIKSSFALIRSCNTVFVAEGRFFLSRGIRIVCMCRD